MVRLAPIKAAVAAIPSALAMLKPTVLATIIEDMVSPV
jgi:hypothetical protein